MILTLAFQPSGSFPWSLQRVLPHPGYSLRHQSRRLWLATALDSTAPQSSRACKSGEREDGAAMVLLCRPVVARPVDVMRVNLRPRWHGVHAAEISPVYTSMYASISYCIRAALAPYAAAGTAGDRFSAATTATGKPQGAWTRYVEATHLHMLGVEGVHMFKLELKLASLFVDVSDHFTMYPRKMWMETAKYYVSCIHAVVVT